MRRKRSGGGLLLQGLQCWMSSVSVATGPQRPLGGVGGRRGIVGCFAQRHLSLSPHNDSPRGSLLMFVIALSHKRWGRRRWGRRRWGSWSRLINGARRSSVGSRDVGSLFVHLMHEAPHYL